VVELVLIGVRRGEAGDRLIEVRASAKVGRDRQPIAGAAATMKVQYWRLMKA